MIDYLRSFNVDIDLAVEANELVRGEAQTEVPGVKESKQTFEYGTVTTIAVLDERGEEALGKKRGLYVTIEAPDMVIDWGAQKETARILAQKLAELIAQSGVPDQAPVLVIGLGNRQATPDALGPEVVDRILVTRHLYYYAPQVLGPGVRPVSALSPGVLGTTGIDTADIIRGVVENIRPSLVIAVDALVAQNIRRIGRTIQLANTGISPGSGIGSRRGGLNIGSLGVPVVAIGVPTVVQAAVLIWEVAENLLGPGEQNKTKEVAGKILSPYGGSLTVTPKEIDTLVISSARLISTGINSTLHPNIPYHEYLGPGSL